MFILKLVRMIFTKLSFCRSVRKSQSQVVPSFVGCEEPEPVAEYEGVHRSKPSLATISSDHGYILSYDSLVESIKVKVKYFFFS